MPAIALDKPFVRTTSVNVLLCAVAVAVPALSHATALPLYRLEPMRLLIFAAILFTSRRNALLMALWLPLLSLLTSGHPVFPKVVLIQGELALNVAIFWSLFRRADRFALAAAVSILTSKAVYYAAKFLLIRTALLGGDLVATPWVYQLATLVFLIVAGGLVCRLKDRDQAAAARAGEVRHV